VEGNWNYDPVTGERIIQIDPANLPITNVPYNNDVYVSNIDESKTRGYAYDIVLYVFREFPIPIFGGTRRTEICRISFRAIAEPHTTQTTQP
jgi:hypothetical protein